MPKQFKPEDRILNCVTAPTVENDWTFDSVVSAGLVDPSVEIPKEVDLREKWWKVGDQEDTGSCVGWASADGIFRWHFVKAKKLRKNIRLSVRFVWMASKETDKFILRPTTFIEAEGTFLRAALEVARNFGNVSDKELPFRTAKLYPQDYQTFYTLAANLRIAMYHNLGRNLKVWRRWLATEGPILTRLNVDKTWDNVGKNGKLDKYLPATARGGHAIALVGYTQDFFIVRNSWGDYWADEGFAYAADEYAKEAFNEAYGVRI